MALAKRKSAPKKATSKERAGEYVGFRSPKDLKEKLEQAAALSGRSLSTEAQVRLERSFQSQSLRREVLEMMFGHRGAALAFMIGVSAREVGAAVGPAEPNDAWDVGNWLDDPTAFDEVARAIYTIVEGLRPDGAPAKPEDGYSVGFEHGRNTLMRAKTRPEGDIHQLLGAAAKRIKVPDPQPRGLQKSD